MGENIILAAVFNDVTKTFSIVKPFNFTTSDTSTSFNKLTNLVILNHIIC